MAAFLWTAPATGVYTVDTFGATYDTLLHVHADTCGGPELACNDDRSSVRSAVELSLEAGQAIVIVVDGYNEGGDYTVSIEAGPCAPCADADGDLIPDGEDLCPFVSILGGSWSRGITHAAAMTLCLSPAAVATSVVGPWLMCRHALRRGTATRRTLLPARRRSPIRPQFDSRTIRSP